jgi:Fur family transcriptional regulator, iron response regulator
MQDVVTLLRKHGIQPTPQRMAVLEFLLRTEAHPSADDVLDNVRVSCPTVSRATVYNTINLLVEKQLLKAQILKEGIVVFDPNLKQHHHFIDEETGKVYDVPWDALRVEGEESLEDYDVREYQVVLRGKRKRRG